MQRNILTIGLLMTLVLLLGCLPATMVQDISNRKAAGLSPENQQLHDEYYDIGGFHQKVSTGFGPAQTWFDRGLAMCFAFNHEEGVRCFQNALLADPAMPMAYWGLAYALGPNINNMEIEAHQIAEAGFALRLGELHAENGTELERSLIAALAKRHVTPVPDFDDRLPINKDYADAMRTLHKQFPDEPLVATLFAESLMNLQPWNHFTADGQAAEHTPEIVAVLEQALERWPDHPALCHLYIHTIEASPNPGKALAAANRLRNAMPGAGHLVHMPSHIDVLVGDYERTVTANLRAIEVDKQFVKRQGRHNFYTLYRIHNYHFVVYGAMFDGQRDLALRTARELVEEVPDDMLRAQTDFLDAFMPTALHVMVRFGMWDDILNEPEPAEYLPMSRSVRHYARAISFAATGRVQQAEAEQTEFHKTRAIVPETSILFNNTSQDILGIAEAMIAGEIEYRKGNFDAAFEHLREAVRRDDALNYDEPWGWMQPARHALGALLLEQGNFTESEAVYRADLRKRPNNPWSLYGLADALEKQGRSDEAKLLRDQFEIASQRSDVNIDRSCFCKNNEFAESKNP